MVSMANIQISVGVGVGVAVAVYLSQVLALANAPYET